MSRAFVKEDIDPPERSARARSASGLPPGAVNYITAEGAARLWQQLDELRRKPEVIADQVAELSGLLASVTVVEAPADPTTVAFGAQVTVRDSGGELTSYRIVGVDESGFYPNAVTWVSPIGKALLVAELGDRITLENGERVQVVKVEYPRE